MARKAAQNGAQATRPSRPRDRNRTQSELEVAFKAILEEKSPLTFTAVAARANVSTGLIHNTYPEIAKKIREASKRSRGQPSGADDELTRLKSENVRLNAELKDAKADIAKLGSIVATLREGCRDLKAGLSPNVVPLKTSKR